jgi:DNA-binding beta-propeller fold protein YncE
MAQPACSLAVLAAVAALAIACQQEPTMSAAADALTLESKIPLGAVAGRIDHLAIDLARRRLFVAELGNDSLGIVDLGAGKVLHRIVGLREPQGVGYVAASDAITVANAGDGSLRRFGGADFAPLGTLDLGEDADNVRVDARASQVIVGYGGGALAVLDAASGGKTAEIRLAGHPESFQLEPSGKRIFVNVPDARQIAIVDRTLGKQVATWAVPDAAANFPMALDDAGNSLFVAYREPALLAVFDTRDGSVAARLAICRDADDVFFDARRQRIYVSCGAGSVDIVQREGETYRSIGRIATVPGARTALFVPDLDRLLVAVRAAGNEPAAIWVLRPVEP